jgi:hypothetical protein
LTIINVSFWELYLGKISINTHGITSIATSDAQIVIFVYFLKFKRKMQGEMTRICPPIRKKNVLFYGEAEGKSEQLVVIQGDL